MRNQSHYRTLYRLTIIPPLLVALILTGCPSNKVKNLIPHVKGSVWESEDGRISFTIESPGSGVGEIFGEKQEDIVIIMTANSVFEIYPTWVLKEKGIHQEWAYLYGKMSYESEVEFSVTVKESTFYEQNENLTFRCICEGK